ncbi:hypothetical protein XSR1_350040 [Xenorhabdus szentirmaii DSM 16338]|uniref:Uncharacterized protein n=1 Tax=Xenorhabdus szentirmaii DSM 16338 TaxID=1427518 RepID=W1IYZ2_9GAMM|nr:hypothetical protein XSR1_350040 [Xenorhabdus szentirmaii DSM 16338]
MHIRQYHTLVKMNDSYLSLEKVMAVLFELKPGFIFGFGVSQKTPHTKIC